MDTNLTNKFKDIRPLHNCVLIKRDEPKTETAGGLYIPQQAQEQAVPVGTVVAIGPGKVNKAGRFIETQLKVGARVLLSKTAFSPVKVRGEKLIMVFEDDILAEVTDD